MLDEFNTDILERSYVFEDRTPLGSFSPKFTKHLQTDLREAASAGNAAIINRQD